MECTLDGMHLWPRGLGESVWGVLYEFLMVIEKHSLWVGTV